MIHFYMQYLREWFIGISQKYHCILNQDKITICNVDKYYKDLANIKTIMMGSKDSSEVSEKSSDIEK